MKTYPFISSTLSLLGAAIFSTLSLDAQEPVPLETAPAAAAEGKEIGADQLEELVAPVALYPDALIALIFPASTVSSDIVLAARFLKSGGTINQIEAQPWDNSVKGLAHYPDVVKWMDENLSWTQRLGEAYLAQPQAVMDAVQRARAIARANGVLVDTPQQRVVLEDNYIRIIPAQPDVIYVPRYDPEVIYVERPLYYYPDPWVTFGIGFGVGYWLSYDCDWSSHSIWVDHHHHRHNHWNHHGDWRYRSSPGRPGYSHGGSSWSQWKPSSNHSRAPRRDAHRWGSENSGPAPLTGAPRFDRERWKRRSENEQFTTDGRPGVERPNLNRTQSSQPTDARREQWQNRQRERSSQGGSTASYSGSIRRPGTTSNVVNNAAASSSQASTAPAATPENFQQVQRVQRERAQGSGSGRDGRFTGRRSNNGTASPPAVQNSQPQPGTQTPGISAQGNGSGRDGRFTGRRSNNGISSPPAVRSSQPQPGTQAPGISAQGERRRGPSERSQDRQSRQVIPSGSQPSSMTARQLSPNVAPAQVPQVRSAPPQQREYRQPARVAQPSAPAPAVASSPPVAVASAPVARSYEGRGDNGNRSSAGNGGGGRSEGRGGRGGRGER